MRPYKRNGPCPKCGLTSEVDFEGRVTADIGTRYMPETNPVIQSTQERGGTIYLGTVSEHLERFCGRCHYTWAEACGDSEEAPDTRPAALRGMEQGLRDIQEQKAKMPSDALLPEDIVALRWEIDRLRKGALAFNRDVTRLGEALGHLPTARPEASAVLMDRWIEEVRQLKAWADSGGCAKEASQS